MTQSVYLNAAIAKRMHLFIYTQINRWLDLRSQAEATETLKREDVTMLYDINYNQTNFKQFISELLHNQECI